MRELSTGLGVIQVIFMCVLAALLVWLALGLGALGLVAWAIHHVATTMRSSSAATEPARPSMSAASAAILPAGTVPVQAAAPQRERTSWIGVAGALLVAAAAVPYLLGAATWLTVALSVAGAIAAVVGRSRMTYVSVATSYALRGAAVLGVLLAVMALFGLWANRPTTLYGENWGDNQGSMLTIDEFQSVLPCLDDEISPAQSHQGFWELDVEGFAATASCRVSAEDGALPVIFVQAESAQQLDDLFAAGIITVDRSNDNDMWVERNGAVAVITADEASGDLSQSTGTTWISLDDEKP